MSRQLVIEIPSVPPNWSNMRVHPIELYRQKKAWFETAYMLSHKARVEAGWPMAAPMDGVREISFTIYKTWPAFDADGAWAAIKPLLDGLKKTLIWDDGGKFIRIPAVDQVRVKSQKDRRVVITVTQEEGVTADV